MATPLERAAAHRAEAERCSELSDAFLAQGNFHRAGILAWQSEQELNMALNLVAFQAMVQLGENIVELERI